GSRRRAGWRRGSTSRPAPPVARRGAPRYSGDDAGAGRIDPPRSHVARRARRHDGQSDGVAPRRRLCAAGARHLGMARRRLAGLGNDRDERARDLSRLHAPPRGDARHRACVAHLERPRRPPRRHPARDLAAALPGRALRAPLAHERPGARSRPGRGAPPALARAALGLGIIYSYRGAFYGRRLWRSRWQLLEALAVDLAENVVIVVALVWGWFGTLAVVWLVPAALAV